LCTTQRQQKIQNYKKQKLDLREKNSKGVFYIIRITRLFITVISKKIIKPAYAPFIILLEYLKALVFLSIFSFRIFLAKRYVKPIKKVAEIFNTKNTKIFELIIPIIKGLSSEAPKYITPIIVVIQSTEPNRIIKKLGNTSAFNVYIEAFSFSLLPLPSQNMFWFSV
jgi:hypothetical protein